MAASRPAKVTAAAPAAAAVPLLSIVGLSAWYGELRAIWDVSLDIHAGDVLAIIGANGAGKSTLLKSITGLMNRGAAAHTRGRVELGGRRLDALDTGQIVDAGVTLVPEGRRLFARMSVEDNLLAGAFLPRVRPLAQRRLAEMYRLFPKLAERRLQVVSQMSGGEQQMVAIARALMSQPRLVLFDELSLGLAPAVVDDIYRKVAEIHAQGTTCVIVEQDMKRALAVANRVCVMLEGAIVLEGTPATLSEAQITAAYFGTER
ncbi:MAG: ABC transporter ATP-binding protein [Burkholderiales bacterium]|jgi:branched-chain amino acid transport system ATP-binding protein|nr:ABC transporter ATP-binding protein [Burkholderiales bacterium]